MKITERDLNKLLTAAKAAQPVEDSSCSFSRQARILSAWRAARLAQEKLDLAGVFRLLRYFRLGLGVACILMLLVVGLSVRRLRQEPYYELASPVAAMKLALNP